MNKLYLWGIIITAAMLGFTYMSVAGSKGGLNGDIVNILTIAAAVALVLITVFVVIKYVRQMQVDTADGELVDDSWDDIGEFRNPVPQGWAVIFLATMVWAAWYFTIGYPVNSYSQIGEYNEDTKVLNDKFTKDFADKMQEFSEEEKTEYMINMGESVFLSECKVCHGLSADGIDGKSADLNVWGSAKAIVDTINNGAKGLNYPMGDMPDRNGIMNANKDYAPITDLEIEIVSSYVANGMKGEGSDVFAGACSSCHGLDGKGMGGMSPNLASYGTAEFTVDVLNRGKKGFIGSMPAFNRLNATQKQAVGAYITSLTK